MFSLTTRLGGKNVVHFLFGLVVWIPLPILFVGKEINQRLSVCRLSKLCDFEFELGTGTSFHIFNIDTGISNQSSFIKLCQSNRLGQPGIAGLSDWSSIKNIRLSDKE